jgi:phosphohistidine phosphatase
MELILWRHAQAVDGEPDAARVLTPRGEKDARRVATWLAARLPAGARLLCSPTMRTRQTADALGRRYRVLEAIGPGAAPEDVRRAAGGPGAPDDTVVLVGHQPWVGQTAALLLAGRPHPWSVRKGALWWLAGEGGEGDDGTPVRVRAVLAPDALGRG